MLEKNRSLGQKVCTAWNAFERSSRFSFASAFVRMCSEQLPEGTLVGFKGGLRAFRQSQAFSELEGGRRGGGGGGGECVRACVDLVGDGNVHIRGKCTLDESVNHLCT